MTYKAFRTFNVGLWLAVPAALTGSGCGPDPTASNPTASNSAVNIGAIDRTGSTVGLRQAQLDQLDTVATAAAAKGERLSVWAFDTTPVQVWGPECPASTDDLADIKDKQFGTDRTPHMTRPALLLEAIAADPVIARSSSVALVIMTDGDQEYATDLPRLSAAARTLGGRKGFRIVVIDVNPENRRMWTAVLAREFGDRFVVAGQAEAQAVLQQFLKGDK